MQDLNKELSAQAEESVYLFEKNLPWRIQLQETISFLGNTSHQACLDIGAENPMISHYLREHGGNWKTALSSSEAAEAAAPLLGDDVQVMKGAVLPFEKKTFDVVVILGDLLERVGSDCSLMEECNRVLKSSGRLIVHVNRRKSWSLANLTRNVLGQSFRKMGRKRAGYTEQELFHILKDGFDVHQVRTYSRLFLEITDAVVAFLRKRMSGSEIEVSRKVVRLYSVANILYRLSDQLDMILFMSKGFRLVAGAKRRSWRSRRTPVLNDGRRISEAVLSKLSN